jgi:hypothetical protein
MQEFQAETDHAAMAAYLLAMPRIEKVRGHIVQPASWSRVIHLLNFRAQNFSCKNKGTGAITALTRKALLHPQVQYMAQLPVYY